LLGQVVANLRATSYEKAVSERLLSPLGLDRTSWAPEPPAASGYDVHPHGDHVAPSPAMELRSLASLGQLWSTVGDLGRWGCFLSDPDLVPGVLATDTVAGMHSPLTVTDLSGWSEAGGTGVSLYRHRDQVYGGHGGSMPGFLAKLVYTRPSGTGPAGGVAVGVVSNADGGPDLHTLALDLCSTVAGAAHRPEPWAPGPPPPAEVEAVLGAWWSGAEQMVLRHRSGRLEAVDPDDPAAPVVELVGDGPGCYRAVSGGQRGERLVVEVDGAALPVRLLFATYAYQRSPGRTPLREKG
ncbi:MAG: serine hydrolase domain-containing protein, partial [Acidimicrobiales bacterium]